jgi:hypothetical protein
MNQTCKGPKLEKASLKTRRAEYWGMIPVPILLTTLTIGFILYAILHVFL